MALTDPVLVYEAVTNLEAHLVCNLLNDAGLEAYVTEDFGGNDPSVGTFQALPGVSGPQAQVWTDRANAEQAQAVIRAHEARQAQRREAWDTTRLPVRVTCADCREPSIFDDELRGTVQTCPSCGAYLDVERNGEEWEVTLERLEEGDPES